MRDPHRYLTDTLDVSRETLTRLEVYAEALRHWQRSINLVAPETMSDLWVRHIMDSAQLIRMAPDAKLWADLGSGAGLPGMIIGILLADDPQACVYLVESNRKKAAFLRDVKLKTGAAVDILPERIESPTVQSRIADVDIVTARALASLSQLFAYTQAVMSNGARALFMKGRGVDTEIADAKSAWSFECTRHQSVSDPAATIVDIRSLSPLSEALSTARD